MLSWEYLEKGPGKAYGIGLALALGVGKRPERSLWVLGKRLPWAKRDAVG